MLTPNADFGPKEHVRQVFKNSVNLKFVGFSNINATIISPDHDIISMNLEQIPTTILKNLVFQIYSTAFIIKSKTKSKDFVVLIRQSIGFFLPTLLCKILKIPVVVEVNGVFFQDLLDKDRGKLLQFINKMTESCTYRWSNSIIVVHENIKKVLISLYSVPMKKIVTIENGAEYRKWISASDAKIRNNINDGCFRIGYLGDLSYRQGIDIILQVIKKLRAEKVKFIFVGGTSTEVYNVREKIKQLDLSKLVEIFEFMPKEDALQIMETCDAFIHLRRRINIAKTDIEGSPLKMMDYHSVGRPVIASRSPSYQYIEEKQFGVLVEIDNEFDIIKGIKTVMNDKEKWQYLAKNSNNYIRNEKNWKKTVESVEHELFKVISV